MLEGKENEVESEGKLHASPTNDNSQVEQALVFHGQFQILTKLS